MISNNFVVDAKGIIGIYIFYLPTNIRLTINFRGCSCYYLYSFFVFENLKTLDTSSREVDFQYWPVFLIFWSARYIGDKLLFLVDFHSFYKLRISEHQQWIGLLMSYIDYTSDHCNIWWKQNRSNKLRLKL